MSRKPIVLKLKDETRQSLEILASATGRSRSDIVSEAVDLYVEEQLSLLVDDHRKEGDILKKRIWPRKV